MKLLIITQKVDKNDDVLGFFHGWITEFSKYYEQVTVIALGAGEYNLPQNVRVFSLGKERGVSRLGYLLNFYRFIWRELKNYDAVFVHMNQEYILLGGVLWKFFSKKITMWRNHHVGSFLTDIAASICDKVFCTSRFSYTAKYKNTIIMPVGVDTKKFIPQKSIVKTIHSILLIGRISPAKRPHLILDAARLLNSEGFPLKVSIYGSVSPKDIEYGEKLKEKVAKEFPDREVSFYGSIPNTKTPLIYIAHEVFVNASPSGMYDKTIFEAMACGTPVITSNENLRGVLPDELLFKENDLTDLTHALRRFFMATPDKQNEYATTVRAIAEGHSLQTLAQKLFVHINS